MKEREREYYSLVFIISGQCFACLYFFFGGVSSANVAASCFKVGLSIVPSALLAVV